MQAKKRVSYSVKSIKERRKERKKKKAVGEKALKKKGRGEFTKREIKTRE